MPSESSESGGRMIFFTKTLTMALKDLREKVADTIKLKNDGIAAEEKLKREKQAEINAAAYGTSVEVEMAKLLKQQAGNFSSSSSMNTNNSSSSSTSGSMMMMMSPTSNNSSNQNSSSNNSNNNNNTEKINQNQNLFGNSGFETVG